MKTIGKIASLLTRYISIIILVCSALAFFKPEAFSWATNYTSIFLGVAMFGMGLTIRAEDFKIVFSRPKEILTGCLLQYTIMPIGAWLLSTLLGLNPDLAIGVILIPVLLGLLLHHLFGRQIERIHEILPLVSVISIVMIISGIVACNKEKVITSGLAVSLATANFAANPLATLPGAIFSVWHNIAGSVFASIRQRGPTQRNK